LISSIPSDAEEDEGGLIVPPLERGLVLFQEYDSRMVVNEPDENISSKAIPATEPFLPENFAVGRVAVANRLLTRVEVHPTIDRHRHLLWRSRAQDEYIAAPQ